MDDKEKTTNSYSIKDDYSKIKDDYSKIKDGLDTIFFY